MTLVTRDTFLFSDTLAANIAYGRDIADLEAVRKAGSAAGLDEVIDRWPDVYQATVGENGVPALGR